MQHLKLKDNFYWIGTQDYNLKTFDIIMSTEYGSTYNSYLLEGEDAIAIFDTTKIAFAEDFIATINEITDVNKVKYLILSHTEPDHTGMISRLLEVHPDIVIVGTQIAINFLKEMVNTEFTHHAIKNGEVLSLGNYDLEFAVLPQLHWPDTMYTYIRQLKTVITCDSFGAHYCNDKMLLSEVENIKDYHDARKYYFEVILGPFKSFMRNGIKFIEDHDIDMIAVGHGPIIDTDIDELLSTYKEWTVEVPRIDKVVITYVSAYGYTKIMAEALAVKLETLNLKTVLFDLETAKHEDIHAELEDAKGLLVGSPTILADAVFPTYNFLATLFPITHHYLKSSAFGSFGWSGEAAGNLIARMTQLRMKTIPGYRAKFKPSTTDLEGLDAWAEEYAAHVLG
ncbi:MAG: FprA family A-type flavoprotein [Erysipelothrix sp.]|nr:FprA family A-type flavoprotein [Erysipelothrix sp.]